MAILVVVVATILIDTVSGWVRRRIIEGADALPPAGEVGALGSPLRQDTAAG